MLFGSETCCLSEKECRWIVCENKATPMILGARKMKSKSKGKPVVYMKAVYDVITLIFLSS
jgi:hypothetical protein